MTSVINRRAGGGRAVHHRQAKWDAASKAWERGRLKSAFRLYLAGAQDGDPDCQLNVGYFYDEGIGVRRDVAAALLWYRRAYRQGVPEAASNIGNALRSKGEIRLAMAWYRRALQAGDDSAALEIAKLYLARQPYVGRAVRYLRRAIESANVCEADHDEAVEILEKIMRRRAAQPLTTRKKRRRKRA